MGQRVEVARLETARHQVVAGALGRGSDQDRRLDLEEAFLIQEVADRLDDPMPQPQVLGHVRAAKIEVAIAQPELLVDGPVLVEREGRGPGPVQDLDLLGLDLDQLHGREVAAPDAHHVLQAQLLGGRMGLGVGRVDLDLDQTAAIAQVEEDQAAQVAPAVDPAVELGPPAYVRRPRRPGRRSGCPAHPGTDACAASISRTLA